MAYHNTTRLSGEILTEANSTANKQDTLILQYFLKYRPTLGASKVHAALMKEGHKILLTSCRRSLTGLSKKGGRLRKLGVLIRYQLEFSRV